MGLSGRTGNGRIHGRGRFLTTRASSKKLKPMGDGCESVSFGEGFFVLRGEAVLDFHDSRALVADQMVVMVVGGVRYQLEPGCSIAEIEALDQAHRGQRVHVPVDGGEVAIVLAEGSVDLAIGQRTRMTSEDVQDCFALPRDLPASGTKPVGEFGEGLLDQSMGMGVLGAGVVHGDGWVAAGPRRKWRVARERMNRNPSVSVIVGPVGRFRG